MTNIVLDGTWKPDHTKTVQYKLAVETSSWLSVLEYYANTSVP